MKSDSALKFRILDASIDSDGGGDLRLLVDGHAIKYIAIDSNIYSPEDLTFLPTLVELLPALPSGDWNVSTISRDPNTGQPQFTQVQRAELPGIKQVWHPTQIEFLELRLGKKLRSNVYETQCDHFGQTVIAKFARFAWETWMLEAETEAYQWIEGHAIGPNFLGHIAEFGRVIGFLISRIDPCRHANLQDLPLCSSILQKLHDLGIKHGDTNKHNFLISGKEVVLIDFDSAKRTQDTDELSKEMSGLKEQFSDESGRGGVTVHS
ncbi:unnamed protein product [Clonostachys solani]|uniref:Alpha-galactosidase A n=1 Tax=Clonostachys solani TaxID=160281 RepID=A0A9N9W4V8_9HYPO|nr:unnamed protein product [Clonostachys solani]